MPTHDEVEAFRRDWSKLDAEQRERFKSAVRGFVEDLQRGGSFRKGLRIKGVKGSEGEFEMTWANDGRATWRYGNAIHGDEPHIIWLRVGTHEIFE